MRVLIVIPTYNESDNLRPLVEAVLKVTPSSVDVLIVDDNSPDGTGRIADLLTKESGRVHVLHRPGKMGLGTAYVSGFKWGLQKDYLAFIEMDADFSHNPNYLPQMLERLEAFDVAVGSRYVPGGGTRNWGLGRKLLSRGGSLYARLILGAPINDFTGGFNGWRREVLESVDLASLRSDGYSFQIELKYRAWRKKFRIGEFPIIFEDRKVGKSKMHRRIVFEALMRVWSFRWRALFLALLITLATVESTTAVYGQTNRRPSTAILVDKKTNTLLVSEYLDGRYKTLKSFHATLGKVRGDKEAEGDLKTPEGIYTVQSKQTPPSLKPKFGLLAYYLNYPNTYDKMAGRTGSNIMLHATNEPERLKRDFDSEGCIVVKNEEIEELQPLVRLGLTPVLIFPELTDEYLAPGNDQRLKTFFDGWIKSWEEKNIEDYISRYHNGFSAQNKNREQWKMYKTSLNSRYKTIQINPENIFYYRHPKYSMVTFTQNYSSTLNYGAPGHRSRGTKIIYIAEEAGQPKIIAETYTTNMW